MCEKPLVLALNDLMKISATDERVVRYHAAMGPTAMSTPSEPSTDDQWNAVRGALFDALREECGVEHVTEADLLGGAASREP